MLWVYVLTSCEDVPYGGVRLSTLRFPLGMIGYCRGGAVCILRWSVWRRRYGGFPPSRE